MRIRWLIVVAMILASFAAPASTRADDTPGGACCVCPPCEAESPCFEGVSSESLCRDLCERIRCGASGAETVAIPCELVTQCAFIRDVPVAQSPALTMSGALAAALVAGLAGILRLVTVRRARGARVN